MEADGWAGTIKGQPRVGQVAERRRVTQPGDISAFTAITGDCNPLHYDVVLAEASIFGRIIVQGGATGGLLNAPVADDLPGPGTVLLAVDWKFRQAVGIGEALTVQAEELTVRKDEPVCTLSTTIRNGANISACVGVPLSRIRGSEPGGGIISPTEGLPSRLRRHSR